MNALRKLEFWSSNMCFEYKEDHSGSRAAGIVEDHKAALAGVAHWIEC